MRITMPEVELYEIPHINYPHEIQRHKSLWLTWTERISKLLGAILLVVYVIEFLISFGLIAYSAFEEIFITSRCCPFIFDLSAPLFYSFKVLWCILVINGIRKTSNRRFHSVCLFPLIYF